jgi:ABC-type antimicrobial peptide transport system permease subunit
LIAQPAPDLQINLRLAIGARPGEVAGMVFRQGGIVCGLGLLAGLAGAAAASPLLGSLLFQVGPFDALTYGTVAGGLLLVSTAACWIPARRAARLDPAAALRTD